MKSLFANCAECASVRNSDETNERILAHRADTSPRRAGHRRLGGTATVTRRKGRGTEEGVGGLLRTPDLGAIRYRDFREVPGRVKNKTPLRTNPNYLSTKERRRDQRVA